MVKTMADWDEEGENMQPNPGESPEEFFNRTGYQGTEPIGPQQGYTMRQESGSYRSEKHRDEAAEFMALQDQMVMEAAGFGKEVVAYTQSLLAGGLPLQAVIVLTREWQQAEITRRTQLDALERRLDHE